MIYFIALILAVIVSLALDLNTFGLVVTYAFSFLLAIIIDTLIQKRDVKWELRKLFEEWWKVAVGGLIILAILFIISLGFNH